jgi:hypothetical protein
MTSGQLDRGMRITITPPLADPFLLDGLKIYEPNHQKARQLATTYRGILSYADSSDILAKDGLKIRRTEYYNLIRKEATVPLSNQEELQIVMTILESNGFHPRTRDEYIVKGGIRTKRVVRDIFFMSDKQIRLSRRFVSGFYMKLMLLSVRIRVDCRSL